MKLAGLGQLGERRQAGHGRLEQAQLARLRRLQVGR
jgi:hypothetical protein